jgi:hypothetical protein
MNQIKLFESKKIRTLLHKSQLFYAVADIVGILSESINPREYWKKLKQREPELGTICTQLPVPSDKDGKMYKIDCATREGLLRIIQAIPSKNAEPFKLWLAQMGNQALDEKANKRLAAHKKLKDTQQKFFENIQDKGVDETGFIKILQSGDKALFDGEDIRKKYGIPENENIDDYLHEVLLRGKDFATAISDLSVKKDQLTGEEEIETEHFSNNKDVRDLLSDKGMKPEDIPTEEDIKKVSKLSSEKRKLGREKTSDE